MVTMTCPVCNGDGQCFDVNDSMHPCETCGGRTIYKKNIWGDPVIEYKRGAGKVQAKRVRLPCRSCDGTGKESVGIFPIPGRKSAITPNPCRWCGGSGKGNEALEFNGKYYLD